MYKKLYFRNKKIHKTMTDFRNLQRGKADINSESDVSESKRFLNNNIHR